MSRTSSPAIDPVDPPPSVEPTTETAAAGSSTTPPDGSDGARSWPRPRTRRASIADMLPVILVSSGALSIVGLVLLAVGVSTSTPSLREDGAGLEPAADDARAARPRTDEAALATALDDLDRQAVAAGAQLRALTLRAERAERVVRVRQLQKRIALARDARRNAGQTGPALKGPFPLEELGPLDDLQLSTRRWLITRDGAVVAPAGEPAPWKAGVVESLTRDEDLASIPARLHDEPVVFERMCVPFEPWCLIDVVGATPAPEEPAVNLAAIRTALTVPDETRSASASTPPTKFASSSSSSPSSSSSTARMAGLLAGLVGAAGALGAAWYLRRLGSDITSLALSLRSGWRARRRHPKNPHVAARGMRELAMLTAACDEVADELAGLAIEKDGAEWRRQRLNAAVATLEEARRHGGGARLEVDDRDDATTARVVLALNALLETLDARHRRIAMAMAEIDGTLRIVTPLSQRLLRLARVEGLPSNAIDELTSLGTSLGQRARRPQVMPALMTDLAPLVPATTSVVDVAVAVAPLGEDGARLAARQLEVVAREGSQPPAAAGGTAILTNESSPPPDRP
jgi:hypothetical protein